MGFGTFESRTRAARKGRNPATGAEIDIPETVVPAFSAGMQQTGMPFPIPGALDAS